MRDGKIAAHLWGLHKRSRAGEFFGCWESWHVARTTKLCRETQTPQFGVLPRVVDLSVAYSARCDPGGTLRESTAGKPGDRTGTSKWRTS